MAISRMQQPRQNYGLGSFVKKLTRKVTKPFTKVARKLVPKEIAGIMRIAAPFMGPVAGPLAYLAGTAKQKGRISPMDLALTFAPQIGKIPTGGGKTLGSRIGDIPIPFRKDDLNVRDVFLGSEALDRPGLVGADGKMLNIFDKTSPGILETQVGRTLFGKPEMIKGKATGDFVPSYLKIGAQALSAGEFIRANKELEKFARETGNEGLIDDLVTTGGVTDSDAYQKFLERLAALNEEAFRVPERLRLPAKGGGLMRTNFAIGSGDDDPKPLPEDPTKPVNPFGPKPIKPLGDMKMAGSDRYQRILEDIINEMEDALGRELTNEEYDLAGQLAYEKLNSPPGSIDYAKGGRVNYALGTKPTAQESGLGGLPIEADMRYTGGFMPYGAKENADDVPARLSKNEFVFTADAVRAAGGGSVQKGAQKMYNTMKQLEAKPEAKGMMA